MYSYKFVNFLDFFPGAISFIQFRIRITLVRATFIPGGTSNPEYVYSMLLQFSTKLFNAISARKSINPKASGLLGSKFVLSNFLSNEDLSISYER